MVQEIPTAQTPEGVPPVDPTAEAPPAPEAGVESQATVGTEEAPPAPEAGAAAPELDPYEVLARPEFKEHLQRRDGRIEENLRGQYNQQLEERTKNWESTQVYQTFNALTGNLSARLEESNLEGADRMLSKLEKLREPYSEAYRKQQQDAGSTATATQLFGLLMNGLGVREQDELRDAAGPGSQWKDIVEKFGALKQKGADDRAYKRLKDERGAAGAASERVQQAKERGAVGALAPGSPTDSTDLTKARQAYAEGRLSTSEAEKLGIVK